MEPRHTPGPWTIYPFPGFFAIIREDRKSVGSTGTEADARLISAAPDLLDAALYCLDMLQQDAGGETVESRIGLIGGFRAAHLLRAAIAKAEGRPE